MLLIFLTLISLHANTASKINNWERLGSVVDGFEGFHVNYTFLTENITLPLSTKSTLKISKLQNLEIESTGVILLETFWKNYKGFKWIFGQLYILYYDIKSGFHCQTIINGFRRYVPFRELYDYLIIYQSIKQLQQCNYNLWSGGPSYPGSGYDARIYYSVILLPNSMEEKVFTKAQNEIKRIPCYLSQTFYKCMKSFIEIITCNRNCFVIGNPENELKLKPYEQNYIDGIIKKLIRNGFWEANYTYDKDSWVNSAEIVQRNYRSISNLVARGNDEDFNRAKLASMIKENFLNRLCIEKFDIWLPKEFSLETKTSQIRKTSLRNIVRPMLLISTLSVNPISRLSGLNDKSEILLTHVKSLNYITCDGVDWIQSFEFFISPYDKESWILFIVFAFFIIPMTFLLAKKMSDNVIDLGLLWIVFYYNVGLILDVGGTLPSKYLGNPIIKRTFKFVIGLFLLALVTLVNAYKGVFVAELTAKPIFTSKFKNLSQLQQFTLVGQEFHEWLYQINLTLENDQKIPSEAIGDLIYCRCKEIGYIKESEIQCNWHKSLVERNYCENFRSRLMRSGLAARKEFMQNETLEDCRNHGNYCDVPFTHPQRLYRIVRKQNNSQDSGFRNLETKIIYSGHDNIPPREKYFDWLYNITKHCNKIAYVSTEQDLKGFQVHLHKKFNKTKIPPYLGGVEPFLNMWQGHKIESRYFVGTELAAKCYERLTVLNSVGIIGHLRDLIKLYHPNLSDLDEKDYFKYITSTISRAPSPLSLSTNIVCGFILLGNSLFVCIVIFIFEIFVSLLNRLFPLIFHSV